VLTNQRHDVADFYIPVDVIFEDERGGVLYPGPGSDDYYKPGEAAEGLNGEIDGVRVSSLGTVHTWG